MDIDVTYDFRNDANGKDPDSHSPTHFGVTTNNCGASHFRMGHHSNF